MWVLPEYILGWIGIELQGSIGICQVSAKSCISSSVPFSSAKSSFERWLSFLPSNPVKRIDVWKMIRRLARIMNYECYAHGIRKCNALRIEKCGILRSELWMAVHQELKNADTRRWNIPATSIMRRKMIYWQLCRSKWSEKTPVKARGSVLSCWNIQPLLLYVTQPKVTWFMHFVPVTTAFQDRNPFVYWLNLEYSFA